MNLNYDVVPTKEIAPGITGFVFVPGNIDITIVDANRVKEDGRVVVVIQSKLRQIIEGGYIEQVREIELPESVKTIVVIDQTTLQPTVNPVALNTLLSQFNLKIA